MENRNIYKGHRYVPKIMGEWNQEETYEGLSIVTHQGTSYTSKKHVPVGIDLTNEDYWTVTGNYNAQVEHYRQEVKDYKQEMTEQVDDYKQETNLKLLEIMVNVKDFGAIGDGATEDTQAINDAIVQVYRLGGGTVYIPEGVYMIGDTGIKTINNLNLWLHPKAILKQIPNNLMNYQTINVRWNENVTIVGGTLIGERYEHYRDETTNTWKMWEPNTFYNVGDLVYYHRKGFKVIQQGTTGTTPPSVTLSIGETVSNGSTSLEYFYNNMGEWGYGIHLDNSTNVTIKNMKIKDYWGDGILIRGQKVDESNNIHLENIVSSNNRRQGLSVITVDGLYIKNSEFNNSNGTLPESGIDFEPDSNNENITNVYLDNVKCLNNKTNNFIIDFRALSSKRDVRIVVNNLSIEGESIILNMPSQQLRGDIIFNDYHHSKYMSSAVFMTKNLSDLDITFNQPIISSDEYYTYRYDDYGSPFILAQAGSDETVPYGGLTINNPSFKHNGSEEIKPFNMMSIISKPVNISEVANIRIINPVDVSGLQNPILRVTNRLKSFKNFVFTDSNNICRFNLESFDTFPLRYSPNIYNHTLSGSVYDFYTSTTEELKTTFHNLNDMEVKLSINANFPLREGGTTLTIAPYQKAEFEIIGGYTQVLKTDY